MRLYCLIPNYVFVEKIAKNQNHVGSIECDDMAGTYHDDYTYELPPVLEYFDKEDWIEDSICAFSTPAECKRYLDDDNVMISFEPYNNEYLILGKRSFYDMIATKIMYEKRMERVLRCGKEEEFFDLQEMYSQHIQDEISNVCKQKDFYDSLIVVPRIDISSVKSFYVLDSNKDIKKIRETSNINLIVENKTKFSQQSRNETCQGASRGD
ncbi:MAG: hypothetical protein ACI4T2_00265 [Christensenellales bacterium]